MVIIYSTFVTILRFPSFQTAPFKFLDYEKSFTSFGLILLIRCKNTPTKIEKSSPPNIILIMADDLGYGDIGVYGQSFSLLQTLTVWPKEESVLQHYSGSTVCTLKIGIDDRPT